MNYDHIGLFFNSLLPFRNRFVVLSTKIKQLYRCPFFHKYWNCCFTECLRFVLNRREWANGIVSLLMRCWRKPSARHAIPLLHCFNDSKSLYDSRCTSRVCNNNDDDNNVYLLKQSSYNQSHPEAPYNSHSRAFCPRESIRRWCGFCVGPGYSGPVRFIQSVLNLRIFVKYCSVKHNLLNIKL